MKSIQLYFFTLVLIFSFTPISAQLKNNDFCGSQKSHENKLKTDENYKKRYQQSQKLINQAVQRNSIDSEACFVVPIVFHVIHNGEAQGSGSNVDDAFIYDALDALNANFANTQGFGEEIPIQFCLAEVDPNSIPTTGITRTDGSSYGNYSVDGFVLDDSTPGDDNYTLKSETSWGINYVNVWIGDTISYVQYPGSNVLGFATLPGTSNDPLTDGIVLNHDVVLNDFYENVFSHEAGHFFNLLHTFSDICFGDCEIFGDQCCDTRTHTNVGGCDESEYLDCEPGYFDYEVSKNYMNYVDPPCMTIFTAEQSARALTALITLRPELMEANTCIDCGQGELSFEFASEADWLFDFTSTASGFDPNSFTWEILGLGINGTGINFQHQFLEEGSYIVVLTGTNNNGCCISTAQVVVVNSCIYIEYEECNLVLNGNLEHVPEPDSDGWCLYMDDQGCGPCFWKRTIPTSPSFCMTNSFNAFVLGNWSEGIQNTQAITLDANTDYVLSYEYIHTTSSSGTNFNTDLAITLGSETLDELDNPPIDLTNSFMSNCHENDEWNVRTIDLNYSNVVQGNLRIEYTGVDIEPDAFMQIRNIKISECNTEVRCQTIEDDNFTTFSKIVSGNSIVTLQNGNYSLAGCLIKDQSTGFNTDHYFLTRDANDEAIINHFTGDTQEEEYFSESTMDQTVLGNTIFSTGYSTSNQTRRDIHITKKHQNSENFTWTKRLDFFALSQTAHGIDAILLDDAQPPLRLFITGETKINNQNDTDIFLQRISGQGSPQTGFRYQSKNFDFAYDLKLIDNTKFSPASAFLVGSSNGRPLGFRVNITTGEIISQFQLKINTGELNAIAQNNNKLYLAGRIENDILLMKYNLITNNVEFSRRISAGERSSRANDIIFHEDFLYLVGDHSGGGDPNKDGILLKINPNSFEIEYSRVTTTKGSAYFKSLDVQNNQLILAGSITEDLNTEMFFVRSTLAGESCCLGKSAHLVEKAPQPFIKPLERVALPGSHRFTYENEKEHLKVDDICYGDGYGFVEETPFQLRNNSEKEVLTIFPNPALDFVNISSNKRIASVEIFNLSGYKISNTSPIDNQKEVKLNTSVFENGMYVLKIVNGDGSMVSRKLMILK